MRYYRLSILVITILVCGSCSRDGLKVQEEKIEAYVTVVPIEFFDGIWYCPTTENKLTLTIDVKGNSIVSETGPKDQIEDLVPVDQGYAVHAFNPKHSDHPHGLYGIFVLKKIDQDRMIVIHSPDVVNLYIRKK